MTGAADAYCIVVGPHFSKADKLVYALCCPHGSVSTIDVEQTFPPEHGLQLFATLARELPACSVAEIAAIEMRLLLGWTLGLRLGCTCPDRPFRVEVSDAGCRFEDAG